MNSNYHPPSVFHRLSESNYGLLFNQTFQLHSAEFSLYRMKREDEEEMMDWTHHTVTGLGDVDTFPQQLYSGRLPNKQSRDAVVKTLTRHLNDVVFSICSNYVFF